jgi:riboflavin kinase/FMN adenylyltransferase
VALLILPVKNGMLIHDGYINLDIRIPVVTIGTFDGVHSGHRIILDKLIRKAKEINGESVVITLNPHPRRFLSAEEQSLTFLTSMEEKKYLLEQCGVDHLVIIRFDLGFSRKEACEFIEEVLVKNIRTKHLIVGFNHRFGKGGQGDFQTIRKCAEKFDLSVEMIDEYRNGSGIVSSTAIRDALLDGDLEKANNMLGYSYFMNGTIIGGRKLGRALGYPTANIKPDSSDKLIPKDGVYAVEIIIGNEKYSAVMSIGLNPTVNKDSDNRTIEVNIFNFKRDIYGETIRVVFRFRLRDEMTFGTLDDLVKQIEVDKNNALRLLS